MNSYASIDLERMSDQDHLASLRRTHLEIDCAMLIDLQARTVLCVSSHIDQPQETLDELCRACSRLVGERFGNRSEFCLATPVRSIIVHRVGDAEETALVVIFEPGVELGVARETTRRACAGLRV